MNLGIPIKPTEIPVAKAVVIPPFVFDCFNKLIVLNFSNGKSHFLLREIAKMVEEECKAHNMLYNFKFLDVEDAYRANGWKVEYDYPAYCETYDASFTFTEL